jgi:hypothetical protein
MLEGIRHEPLRPAGGTRREALVIGGLSALGVGLCDLFRQRAQAGTTVRATARKAILIWLDGGPSHLDMFDPKPEAPVEVRGPFETISTRVSGVAFSELLPETAARMDRLCLIRSLTSPLGEHSLGSHYMLTGYKPTPVLTYPSLGSLVASSRGDGSALPGYVAVPGFNRYAGQGFLASQYGPFSVVGDPSKPDFRVRDLDPPPGVEAGRLDRRREFAQAIGQLGSSLEREPSSSEPLEQAWRLLASSEARQAFNLADEPADLRARYGPRTLGQSCLLARRLIEAGVPFVTVTDTGWDTHDALVNRLKEGYSGGTVGKVPTLDLALSALMDDLRDRGLWEETLVVVMGEFGRTPKLNPSAGRDHWPRAFSVLLGGGGLAEGVVVGESDRHGESPADRPVAPEDLGRTLLVALGIDPDLELTTPDGRPIRANQGGKTVDELLA